jgi:UDP:flavonoid glycosyltransferase YjiC (YdhE family)
VSRILMVWELGANLGHIDRMLLVARVLRERGHVVRMLLKDVSRAHRRVVAEGYAMGQSPVWLPRLANPPRLGNYGAVLMGAGWLDAQGLAGLLAAWRDALDLAQPDLLVCDHAPTAMLAARGASYPVWAVGNSFEVPPGGDCFPSLQVAPDAAEVARCPGYDAQVLASANQGLALAGLPPLQRLTDLFQPVHQAIAALPELAHYAGYGPDTFWAGPCYAGDAGVMPPWPAGQGPRVFAYLDPTHAEFNPLMAALRALQWPAVVHAPGLTAQAAQRLGGPQLHFSLQPVQLDAAMAQAMVAISHASAGTVTAAALAGRMQLGLPLHAEQLMTAERITQSGVGIAIPVGRSGNDFEALLRKLVDDPAHARAAQTLAERHHGATPQRMAETLADRIEATL